MRTVTPHPATPPPLPPAATLAARRPPQPYHLPPAAFCHPCRLPSAAGTLPTARRPPPAPAARRLHPTHRLPPRLPTRSSAAQAPLHPLAARRRSPLPPARRYAAGGPLRRLASSGATRAEHCATAEGGWLAGALDDLRRISAAEIATGLPPELIGGTADAADAAAAAAADAATLRELGELGELLRRLQAQGRSVAQGGSWLDGWRPLLVPQHGALAASAVLVDSAGTLWLTDLAAASVASPSPSASPSPASPSSASPSSAFPSSASAFGDAAALLASLLFEGQPSSDERAAEQAYGGIAHPNSNPNPNPNPNPSPNLVTLTQVGGAGTVFSGRPKRRRWFAGDSEAITLARALTHALPLALSQP